MINNVQPYDVAYASQLLDNRIRDLRVQNKDKLLPGNQVKLYTQSNEIYATLVSMASVQAVIQLVDGSQETVDLAMLTLR